jgi:hypothetical protein
LKLTLRLAGPFSTASPDHSPHGSVRRELLGASVSDPGRV